MNEVTLTNEAALKIFMDGPREEHRYFTISVPRDSSGQDGLGESLESKLSPAEVSSLSFSNSCLYDHFFFVDIRDFAFREGKDGKIYYTSLPKYLVIKTLIPHLRFYQQVLHMLHGKFSFLTLQSKSLTCGSTH